MLDHLISANQSVKALIDKNLEDEDIVFIKELIDPDESSFSAGGSWNHRGRDKDKSFLYEVGMLK